MENPNKPIESSNGAPAGADVPKQGSLRDAFDVVGPEFSRSGGKGVRAQMVFKGFRVRSKKDGAETLFSANAIPLSSGQRQLIELNHQRWNQLRDAVQAERSALRQQTGETRGMMGKLLGALTQRSPVLVPDSPKIIRALEAANQHYQSMESAIYGSSIGLAQAPSQAEVEGEYEKMQQELSGGSEVPQA
ncbi:MAG: hypothetical protein Q7S29_04920 [Candidatus Peribacter sp.]|nr:hypothetical protein [Candidatus Peribacter sp.]